jgi:hypothetical protein
MDEAHYVEELAFIPYIGSTSVAAHCMCFLDGRNIVFVGAGSKLWLLIGEDGRDQEQFYRELTRPIFLSRDLEAVFSDSSDERVLCLWSLPVDDYIQHPDCEPSSQDVPLITVAFGRPFGEKENLCRLLIFNANQLVSDTLSPPKSDHASNPSPLAVALDTLPLEVAPMLLRFDWRSVLSETHKRSSRAACLPALRHDAANGGAGGNRDAVPPPQAPDLSR